MGSCPDALKKPWWGQHTMTNDPDGLPDTKIVPYINALNEQGFGTQQSCAGHCRDNGYRDDGEIWFDHDVLTQHDAQSMSNGRVMFVSKRWGPWDDPHWKIVFDGMATSKTAFEESMEQIFRVIGADLP